MGACVRLCVCARQIVDHFVFDLEVHVHRLEEARQAHELEALSVGLNYFDRDEKGAITPSECPELSARLFDVLDTDKDGRISRDDLMKAVSNNITALASTMERIRQLQREIDELREKMTASPAAESLSVLIAQNEALIEEKKEEATERERTLRAIFSRHTTTQRGGRVSQAVVASQAIIHREMCTPCQWRCCSLTRSPTPCWACCVRCGQTTSTRLLPSTCLVCWATACLSGE